MDPNLVEKITRLVIANLDEYKSSNKVNAIQSSSVEKNPNYHPLSKAEIDEWQKISTIIGNPSNEGNSYLKPLNEEEFEIWQSISSKINDTNKDNPHEPTQKRVKIFPHH